MWSSSFILRVFFINSIEISIYLLTTQISGIPLFTVVALKASLNVPRANLIFWIISFGKSCLHHNSSKQNYSGSRLCGSIFHLLDSFQNLSSGNGLYKLWRIFLSFFCWRNWERKITCLSIIQCMPAMPKFVTIAIICNSYPIL